MTILLFVTKPITFFIYLLGVILMVLLSFQDGNRFWFTCVWLIPAFSVFYCTSLNYHYLLRGNEKFEIKGVDIRIFKRPFKVYLVMSLIGLMMSIILFSHTDVVFFSAFLLLFYNGICSAILKCVIYAKFFSIAIKKNPSLKQLDIQDLYTDIREILMKKVMT